MNTVIEFPRNRLGGGPRNESTAPAEVVIFPGVRIERTAFSLAERIAVAPKRTSASARAKELEGA